MVRGYSFSLPFHPKNLERPLVPHFSPRTHSSRADLKLGLCFWYVDEGGAVRGEIAEAEHKDVVSDKVTNSPLTELASMFTSLPVLTFKSQPGPDLGEQSRGQ